MKFDFHIHSRFSDGSATTEEIFHMAKEKGLSALSLTDHDSILGLPLAEKLSRETLIPYLSGAEFTVMEDGKTFHVLGYNLNPESKELKEYSKHILSCLNEISKKQILLLQKHGITLSEETYFQQGQGGPLYRGKLLKALSDHGIIKESEIMPLIPRYFGKNGLCHVSDTVPYLNFDSIVKLIKGNGGIVVLAHPAKLKKKDDSLYQRIIHHQNLDGFEVYHPSITDKVKQEIMPIIEAKNLIITGGSDYHGLFQKYRIEVSDMQIPDEIYHKLYPYLRNSGRNI